MMDDVADLPVTVVIPVKNEEKNLPACLERLRRFARTVVVDSGSTDTTCEIARVSGAEVVSFEWSGKFPKKRNWMLLNYDFATDWVLFLDADELVDEVFCEALEKVLTNTESVGFWLHYTNYFLGRPLRYGIPQRKLALFRVGAGLYERIEEDAWSRLDMEIHEHPILEGEVGVIKARIDHKDLRGLEKFLARHVEYAKWEAARHGQLSADDLAGGLALTERQKFKYKYMTKWWYPGFYFLVNYVTYGAILDGRAGFLHSTYKAWYFQTIQAFIHENHQSKSNNSQASV